MLCEKNIILVQESGQRKGKLRSKKLKTMMIKSLYIIQILKEIREKIEAKNSKLNESDINDIAQLKIINT